MPKARYTGEGVPTSRVIKSRSYVVTQPKPRHKVSTKSARDTRVTVRFNTPAQYLAWLDRD